MPRYRYKCRECEQEQIIFHKIEEAPTECTKCAKVGALDKMLTTPFVKSRSLEEEQDPNVGTLTHEYIEANRDILKKQQEELKKKSHEPS